MNPFLRYLADKNSAHRQTDRQTDRHTPMTTRPCGLRRAGNEAMWHFRGQNILWPLLHIFRGQDHLNRMITSLSPPQQLPLGSRS